MLRKPQKGVRKDNCINNLLGSGWAAPAGSMRGEEEQSFQQLEGDEAPQAVTVSSQRTGTPRGLKQARKAV